MTIEMKALAALLEVTAAMHRHLCPRQVLGVRMGLLAGQVLGLDLPRTDKRLLTIVETDGCACDGIAVATNCWVGRRMMRVVDFGKVAATFVDTHTERAVRIVPRIEIRQQAIPFATEARNKWEAQLLGYQRMPAADLLSVQTVWLKVPIEKIIGRAGKKAICEVCGEEVINEREIIHKEMVLCRACAGEGYYTPTAYWAKNPWDMAVEPDRESRGQSVG